MQCHLMMMGSMLQLIFLICACHILYLKPILSSSIASLRTEVVDVNVEGCRNVLIFYIYCIDFPHLLY
jgi:hypothetical protein